MDADQIFKITNSLAFFSWIPLLIAPFNARIRNVLLGITVTRSEEHTSELQSPS